MSEFNAKARAEHCVSDLDGELCTYTNDDFEDCVNVTVFETLERYIQSAFEAGRASRDAEFEQMQRAHERTQTLAHELRAQLAEMREAFDRLKTAIDEHFGMQPTMTPDEAVLFLDQEICRRNAVRDNRETEQRGTIAKLAAERDALIVKLHDDPELDATDGAHPAWWRGHDHVEAKFRELIAAKDAEIARLRTVLDAAGANKADPEQAARVRLGRWLTANHRRCWKSHGNDGDGYQVWLYKNAHRESAWNGSGPTLPEAIDDALDVAERSGTW